MTHKLTDAEYIAKLEAEVRASDARAEAAEAEVERLRQQIAVAATSVAETLRQLVLDVHKRLEVVSK